MFISFLVHDIILFFIKHLLPFRILRKLSFFHTLNSHLKAFSDLLLVLRIFFIFKKICQHQFFGSQILIKLLNAFKMIFWFCFYNRLFNESFNFLFLDNLLLILLILLFILINFISLLSFVLILIVQVLLLLPLKWFDFMPKCFQWF